MLYKVDIQVMENNKFVLGMNDILNKITKILLIGYKVVLVIRCYLI
jgi:hypothetical protein